jgi:hypothetical protein
LAADGAYLLRSNQAGWSAAEFWETYMQLTVVERALPSRPYLVHAQTNSSGSGPGRRPAVAPCESPGVPPETHTTPADGQAFLGP